MTGIKPTKSKDLFIGRSEQLDTFRSILDGNNDAWIVHVPGDGGIGKTKLLEQYATLAADQEKLLATLHLVDFYKTHNQTIPGVLLEISTQLGREHFPRFNEGYEEYQSLINVTFGSIENRRAQERLSKDFFEDYAALIAEGFRVVLLFDTCEEMHGVLSYILNEFLYEIQSIEQQFVHDNSPEESDSQAIDSSLFKSTVVLAGRKKLKLTNLSGTEIVSLSLQNFTLSEAKELFSEGDLDVEDLEEADFKRLHDKTGGRPLFVVLSYDWLKYELGTLEELVAMDEPFGQKLVQWINRLNNNWRQAIVFAALAWRRMEPSLLAYLLPKEVKDPEKVIEELSQFSFIKYRSPEQGLPGTFQLHDEMRKLVVDYILTKEGPFAREDLLSQIIEWYKINIEDPKVIQGHRRPTSERQRELLAEYLYYECELDDNKGFKNAFEIYERLFRHASHHRDLVTCGMLIEEAERFITKLPNSLRDDHRFRQALYAFYQEDYVKAEEIWNSLVRSEDVAKNVRATTIMMLVEVMGYTGEQQRALELAKESKALYDEILAEDLAPDIRKLCERELGTLYNNWGYIYRVLGKFDTALDYYNRALRETDDRYYPKNYARTLNNTGYVYFLKGDLRKARTYIGQSLQIRKGLDVPYELGLSYNTLGMILEAEDRIANAIDSFDKAFASFLSVRSDYGQALVRLNRGRIYRITNIFERALEELEPAYTIFKKLDNKDYLIKVTNEIGCLYRDKTEKEEADWENAQKFLEESLEVSKELGRADSEADNWEDLSILYERWAKVMRDAGNEEEATKFTKEARRAIDQVADLLESSESYLPAKAESTLGNLSYDSGAYAEAFDHYLKACLLMTQAMEEEKEAKLQPLRRYQEMADRLQEQLHALPEAIDTIHYSQEILAQIERLKPEDQEKLKDVTDLVNDSVELARMSSSVKE